MIKRISSVSDLEDRYGYCRAVVAGGFVHVAGTVAGPEVPEDAASQCQSALARIAAALEDAGSGFDRAVRVTYYLPELADFEACQPLLQTTFGPNPPAATMIQAGLIDPKYKIEIELTALASD